MIIISFDFYSKDFGSLPVDIGELILHGPLPTIFIRVINSLNSSVDRNGSDCLTICVFAKLYSELH